MNGTPRFSVVIPAYNSEHVIGRAVSSCLAQTVQPEEIIIIDDCSTDGTASAISSIGSPLVKYFRNAENKGPSFSRNEGMLKASGDWILFLDADDRFHPDKIRIVQKCLQAHRDILAIGHRFSIGMDAGPAANVPAPRKLTVRQVLLRNPAVTPSLAVARNNGIFFDEQIRYAEDHDFILRTAEAVGFWMLDLPLCTLGRAPLSAGGQSSHRWQMRKGEMKMYLNYARRNRRSLIIPGLLFFSLLKHVRFKFFPRGGSK
ncbi:MAG: glycosyltransferase family 2 protein [Chitinophagaceae bacterium]|nr:glycosyltransferase family 2 protein [Chitinophagaceae bacterium]